MTQSLESLTGCTLEVGSAFSCKLRFGFASAGPARDLTAGKLTSNMNDQIADIHGRQ